MSEKLTPSEKLKSRKKIELLFQHGKGIKKFPILLVHNSEFDTKEFPEVGFSVSKRNFKLAVDRNRLKRLMREAYRKNKSLVDLGKMPLASMFIFIGKKQAPFDEIQSQMQKIFKTLNSSENEQS